MSRLELNASARVNFAPRVILRNASGWMSARFVHATDRILHAVAVFAAQSTLSVAGSADPLATLNVDGFRPAVVSIPTSAPNAAPGVPEPPVVVALHGNYDRPEWQCEVWRQVTRASAFIVCPRGVPRTDAPPSADRWTWSDLRRTDLEVRAALEAFSREYGDQADSSAFTLAGFSLGASMAARLATRSPERFSRLVIIEGGADTWSLPIARRFRAGGGQRVLAACGQPACFGRFRQLRWAFEKAALPLRVVGSTKAGHTYDGDVAARVAENWEWLIAGEAR